MNVDLKKLILPLIGEQFLQMAVGLVDSILVASVGEAAVSGVSLVDTIFILFINVFSALATGGVVVVGQYIGRKDPETACRSAWQLILFISAFSIILMVICYLCRDFILYTVFGDIEADVRHNGRMFLMIVSASIPFIAIYNAGVAIFRVMGDSKMGMLLSLMMNLINLCGAAFLIFVLHFGVEGAAIPTLVSRIIAAFVVVFLLFKQKRLIHIPRPVSFKLDFKLLKRILNIALPNGLESSMFQIGKILVLSIISGFGTAAIAANAVCNYVAGLGIVPGIAMGFAMITVVSRCVGAREYQQVKTYTRKLIKQCYLMMIVTNGIIMLAIPLILSIYGLSDQANEYIKQILIYNCICSILIWPLSFTLPNTLRASNDVAFTMIIAIVSMWVFRIGFCYILGVYLGWGVFGVWVAMTLDWLVRSVFFVGRYRRGKWMGK